MQTAGDERPASAFGYGIGHRVDFTDEGGLYKPVIVSAREIALPEEKPFTCWVRVPHHNRVPVLMLYISPHHWGNKWGSATGPYPWQVGQVLKSA